MEKRIGVIAVLVTDTTSVAGINDALHAYGRLVLGRQGIPYAIKASTSSPSSSKAIPTSSEPSRASWGDFPESRSSPSSRPTRREQMEGLREIETTARRETKR